jgi:hypothetical protein
MNEIIRYFVLGYVGTIIFSFTLYLSMSLEKYFSNTGKWHEFIRLKLKLVWIRMSLVGVIGLFTYMVVYVAFYVFSHSAGTAI